MLVSREWLLRLAVADLAVFLLAVALNDHSNTSFDGILWWIAISGFAALIVLGTIVLFHTLWGRARRARTRAR